MAREVLFICVGSQCQARLGNKLSHEKSFPRLAQHVIPQMAAEEGWVGVLLIARIAALIR